MPNDRPTKYTVLSVLQSAMNVLDDLHENIVTPERAEKELRKHLETVRRYVRAEGAE